MLKSGWRGVGVEHHQLAMLMECELSECVLVWVAVVAISVIVLLL